MILRTLFVVIWFAACGAEPVRAQDVSQPEVQLENGRVMLTLQRSLLDRDLLFVRDRAGQRLVRFVQNGNGIELISPPIETLSGPVIHAGAGFLGETRRQWRPSKLVHLPISSKTADSIIIDITTIFSGDVEGLQGDSHSLTAIKPSTLRIDGVRSHKLGADVWGTETRASSSISSSVRRLSGYDDNVPITIKAYWSLIVLPEEPMEPRTYDPRMGFHKLIKPHLTSDYLDFTGDPILRWRLKKKDPELEVSDPVEPIVFYLDPSMPEKWRPWVREGVLAWLPAFEAAGFSNAIEVRDPPTNGPNFSIYSPEFSVIRWSDWGSLRQSEIRRSRGRGAGSVYWVFDERTGEIIKGDILIGGPSELLRDRYFVRAAAVDPRAQRIPFPDELMGELYKSLTAHEAGHAFGLRDGNYGEYVYPAELARSREWLMEMGHTPSIMTYARENYLVQPGDNIEADLLFQKVGPADHYAIRWGYSVFDPEEEMERLENIVREQDEMPWYRFTGYSASVLGPDRTNNVVDNNDPVESSRLGLLNLRRTMSLLPTATLHEDGGNALLEHMYFRVLDHWVNLMLHPVSMIGGVTTYQKSGAQAGPIYTPVPANRQRSATVFINENAFRPPLWLDDEAIVRRFESQGSISNINGIQERVLSSLLSSRRLNALTERGLSDDVKECVYSLAEMLSDLRSGIWSELSQRRVAIGPYRQGIQADHIRILVSRTEQNGSRREADRLSDYAVATLLGDLEILKSEIEDALPKTRDPISRAHLARMLDELASIGEEVN